MYWDRVTKTPRVNEDECKYYYETDEKDANPTPPPLCLRIVSETDSTPLRCAGKQTGFFGNTKKIKHVLFF